MSAIKIIPRGLRVLIVMAILAVLTWKFATGIYFFPGIIVAVILTIGVIFLTYRSPGPTTEKVSPQNNKDSIHAAKVEEKDLDISAEDIENITEGETIPVEEDITDIPPSLRRRIDAPFRSISAEIKPDAKEIAAKYYKMSRELIKESETSNWNPAPRASSPEEKAEVSSDTPTVDVRNEGTASSAFSEQAKDNNLGTAAPPVPLVEDESLLTLEDKNELVNAVWCRCENPFCKYTRFLSVHHIVDEKEGGTNRLDNLIVFCPYCHDLAHRNQIPEKEMREWISNREERFKFKPQWKHF